MCQLTVCQIVKQFDCAEYNTAVVCLVHGYKVALRDSKQQGDSS